jgi:hypothetical protein
MRRCHAVARAKRQFSGPTCTECQTERKCLWWRAEKESQHSKGNNKYTHLKSRESDSYLSPNASGSDLAPESLALNTKRKKFRKLRPFAARNLAIYQG